jgi:hypothetical protein
MRKTITLVLLVLVVSVHASGQRTELESIKVNVSALTHTVAHFDVTDSTLVEALSKLSLQRVDGLHLGIEEILRQSVFEAPDQSVRFSLNLEDATVGDIVEKLCQFDSRYTWSTDGSMINVYPRQIVEDPAYLLNREIERIALDNTTEPYQALTPLAKLFPTEQIGYAGIGIAAPYPEPWSAVFERLTVRQLMNRIAEHSGPRGGWIWQGSKDQRFFWFFQFGFQR